MLTGIDHTAIVMENTGKSLVFYRRLLEDSEDFGVERKRPNNVAIV